MQKFLNDAAMQNHPLRLLQEFLKREEAYETAKEYTKLRFVGYALEIGYDTVTIITSDPFKIAVGGVPRNSLLIMVPNNLTDLTLHFTLLRVLESAPTPLTKEVQQTYFELQKRSMPELDVFTQSELQWGALRTGVLGMFYPHPENTDAVEFSGDINNFVSAHKYLVYAPDDELLDLIVNALVPQSNVFSIGKLRLTESRLTLPGQKLPDVEVKVSPRDFMGARTAMFGKTRLGKSNVVKLIAQSLIEISRSDNSVGQLIFDINGEYANDNPQDGNSSLASAYPERCVIYALTQKNGKKSEPLKLNFYEQPDSCHEIVGTLLSQDGKNSGYIAAFSSVHIPSIEAINAIPDSEESERTRAIRRLLIYFAILHKAGFDVDEARLREITPKISRKRVFDPGYSSELRNAAYLYAGFEVPPDPPSRLQELRSELEIINRFRRDNPSRKELLSASKNPTFESDDNSLLDFFDPKSGLLGTTLLQPYRVYHAANAGDFKREILNLMGTGKTVILDLGNANEQIAKYFSDMLSYAVFRQQVNKFTDNNLGNHFVQLYFEEAHNLFPSKDDSSTIYSRFAKEGAKYHIGMVYSTQSPTTISRDLLAQTENFFIAHLSSQDDVNALAKVNIAYESLKDDILRSKTPGYVRMLTRSHRFAIPVQANKFTASEG